MSRNYNYTEAEKRPFFPLRNFILEVNMEVIYTRWEGIKLLYVMAVVPEWKCVMVVMPEWKYAIELCNGISYLQ